MRGRPVPFEVAEHGDSERPIHRRRRGESSRAFYTGFLGFSAETQPAPGFAMLSLGELRLMLSEPGAGGAGQAMPDGRVLAPGGWNRIQVEVEDIDDPAGKPVELFEPARR